MNENTPIPGRSRPSKKPITAGVVGVPALIGAAVAEPPPEAERSNLLIDGRAEESITAKPTRTGMIMDAGTVLGLVEDAGLSPRETIISMHTPLVYRATGATSDDDRRGLRHDARAGRARRVRQRRDGPLRGPSNDAPRVGPLMGATEAERAMLAYRKALKARDLDREADANEQTGYPGLARLLREWAAQLRAEAQP